MVERDIIVASLPGGYEYEFMSSVFEEYHCHICHLPLREPVLTRCGHRYCKKCLDEAIKRYDDLCNISKLAVSGNADEKIVKISSWKRVKSNQDWEVNFVIPVEFKRSTKQKTKSSYIEQNRWMRRFFHSQYGCFTKLKICSFQNVREREYSCQILSDPWQRFYDDGISRQCKLLLKTTLKLWLFCVLSLST